MRALLLAPLAVAVIAAGGFALIEINGGDAHLRDLLNASAVCLIATGLAAIPLFMTRQSSQYAVAQAGLVATMLHLFVAGGSLMLMLMVGRLSTPFLYWLLPLYFATLVPVVFAAIRAVQQAPPDTSVRPTATTTPAKP